MKNDEPNDDLWRLLGQAREPSVSPFFARNVLRSIREQKQERGGFRTWFMRRRQWVPAGLAFLALIALNPWLRVHQREAEIAALAQEVSSSPDYAVITHLDELLALEENASWLSPSAY